MSVEMFVLVVGPGLFALGAIAFGISVGLR